MSFCTKCGSELQPGARFCIKCGAKAESPFEVPQDPVPQAPGQQAPGPGFEYQPEGGLPPQMGYPGGAGQMYPPKKTPVLPIILGIFGGLVLLAGAVLGGSRLITGRFPWESEKSAKEARADKDEDGKDSRKKGGKDDKDSDKDSNDRDAEEDEKDAGNGSQDSGAAAASAGKEETPVNGYDQNIGRVKDLTPAYLRYVTSDVSDYPSVKLYYQVNDDSDQPIILSSPTAGIRESIGGGQYIEREVRRIERLDGRQGISIDIIADKSGSMDNSMAQMQSIMSSFVGSLDYGHGDRAELIAFEDAMMYMCSYTDNVQLLNNGIRSMTAYGNTALYDAVLEGVRNAASRPGAKLVIAFTDGEDNASIHTADEVIYEANAGDVPIYIVGTADAETQVLTRIAQDTGGRYWNINQISDLGQILDEIYKEQKDMYCIEYLSDRNADAYTARNVDFVITDSTCGGSSSDTFTAVKTIEKVHHAQRYELIKADVSWSEANTDCIRRGGHLITITSPEEMEMASRMAESAGLKYVWIGGYTMISGNTPFGHWVTGEDFYQYQAWYPGEPSRNDLDGTEEMYLMLWNVNGNWSWNDQRNDPGKDFNYFAGKTGYICEYED